MECDASVMAGDGTYGAVAAVQGLRNPIAAATQLALDSRQPLSHGRVRAVMLAGDGARAWAEERGVQAATTAAEVAGMHLTSKSQ